MAGMLVVRKVGRHAVGTADTAGLQAAAWVASQVVESPCHVVVVVVGVVVVAAAAADRQHCQCLLIALVRPACVKVGEEKSCER